MIVEEVVNWTPDLMLEISLSDPDDFLKIKETLTRIGIAAKKEDNVLYQSCHILHKQGHYFIVHFKEMFLLDGKYANLTQSDISRRNTIAKLLSDWGLLDIIKPDLIKGYTPMNQIKVITHKDKKYWDLRPKYTIGNSHGRY